MYSYSIIRIYKKKVSELDVNEVRIKSMDKEKKRKFHLVLYGIAIPVSLFALYTFIFVFDNGIGWKIALIIIGLGWLISAISGFIENLKK